MGKLFWGPMWVLVLCELPVQLTFGLARLLGLKDHDWLVAHVITTGVMFALASLITAGCMWGNDNDSWYTQYLAEQKALRWEREERQRKLDAEIGIPRVPERINR